MLKCIFSFEDYYRTEFIKKIAQTIPPGSKVLDAGAGPCRYKSFFTHCDYKSQDFAKYEGKDHSYGQLDYVSDIISIPVPDESFDYIVCTEVFEHIPRPDLALKEFSRLLKVGGQVIITAPLGSGIHMSPYHFYGGFSPYWYQHFMKEVGLSVVSITANHGFFKLYGQESQRFLTILTPENHFLKICFFPIKLILAIWFRLTLPIICHFIDRFDKKKEFTVGYHVLGNKYKTEVDTNIKN